MRRARSPSQTAGPSRAGVKRGRKTEGETRVGISGWRYPGWRGVFYPKGLAQRRELEFASGKFNSIEINGSFYSLQTPDSYRRWYRETPDGFVFSVKGPRFITHMKKLREVEAPLANFFASGVLALGEKLGPILWQLPPNFGWNPERLEDFFGLLPRDTRAASRLARQHDDKLKTKPWFATDKARALRHAIEVRHPSFLNEEFFHLLSRQEIAFVFADTAGKWPYAENLTADFVYIRLHGDKQLYVSGYSDSALEWWARRIRLWRNGKQPNDAKIVAKKRNARAARDVFVYFDNDAKVYAPFNAETLRRKFAQNRATG